MPTCFCVSCGRITVMEALRPRDSAKKSQWISAMGLSLIAGIDLTGSPGVRPEGRCRQPLLVVEVRAVGVHGERVADRRRIRNLVRGDDHGRTVDRGLGPDELLVLAGDGEPLELALR